MGDEGALWGGLTTLDAGDSVGFEAAVRADPIGAVEVAAGWAALAPEVRARRDEVRQLLERLWLPEAAEHFQAGTFDREIFRALGNVGAFGASLVAREGRPQLSRTGTVAVMHAIERADGGLRCAATIQDCVIQALLRYGDSAQQRRWLEPLLCGEQVGAFALTEPDAGSDLRALRTSALRRGAGWVLTGRKAWVTSAPVADVLLVWARTGERNDAVRGFLVERGTPGLEVIPIRDAAVMRAAPLGRLVLDQATVADDALLPHAWGLADINACLDYNRLTVAFGVMGAARACLEIALEHALERRQFGVPLAAKQLVQAQLADMAELVVAGEVLSLHAANRWDAGPLPSFEVSLTKRHNCRVALDVARRARAVLGGEGARFGRGVVRHLLNLEASSTYGGTHEIHGLSMAKTMTGESAF